MGKRNNVVAEVTGTVWKLEKAVGATVAVGDLILIVESMKMEIPIEAHVAGVLVRIDCAEGEMVQEGDTVAVIEA
jgi:acetyl-CoA carboxylase biotin carboxyl carrier protein